MESEKVKEIKKALECCKDRLCEVCPRLKQEPNQEEDCRLAVIEQSLTLINELESENEEKYKRIMELEQDLIHADENVFFRECNVTLKENEIKAETLKQFAERLKEDFTKKKNKLIKEREIAAKYDDFILIDALAYKIDELQYAIDKIDETLKEFLV